MKLDLGNEQVGRVERYCMKQGLIQEGDGIVIGVSGGADSVFLLYAFWIFREKWKLRLSAVHVNHGIRGKEAREDQLFVRKLANALDLPLHEFEENIPALAKREGMTEEEAGRSYRYQCFENVRKELGFSKIAVAHHKNDQAETVLFQLFRGSGLRGLGGMAPKKGVVIRPLLDLTKAEILETLGRYGIEYCNDLTNEENEYSRNRIRNELFPWVEDHIQKRVQEHIAASAQLLQEVMSFLEEQTRVVFQREVKKEGEKLILTEDAFFSCHIALQKELILMMMETLSGRKKDLTGGHVESVRRIFSGETGKRVTLPYNLCAEKVYDQLILRREKTEEKVAWEQELFWDQVYQIPFTDGIVKKFCVERKKIGIFSKNQLKKHCTKCFDYDKIDSVALFRYPLAGDYLWLDELGKKKKLSRIFIDEKIAAERRKQMIVLAEGHHILWIPELDRCSAFYYLTETSKEMIYIHEKGEE